MIKIKNIIILLIISSWFLWISLYAYFSTIYNSWFFITNVTKNISLYTVCITYDIPHCFNEIKNTKIHIKNLDNDNNWKVHKYINKNTIYLDNNLWLYTQEYFKTLAHEFYHLIQFKYLNDDHQINKIYELIKSDKECKKLYYLYDVNFQILNDKKEAIFEMLSYWIEDNENCQQINDLFN